MREEEECWVVDIVLKEEESDFFTISGVAVGATIEERDEGGVDGIIWRRGKREEIVYGAGIEIVERGGGEGTGEF